MTASQIYRLLFEGGNYAKQYLIKLSHPTAGTLRFVNNNEDVVFEEQTYKASSFDYTRPDNQGEAGNLSISIVDNADIFEWVENADCRYTMEVIGILNGGSVEELKSYRHFYGSVSLGDNNQLEFNLENDGRLNMVFNVYKYDTDSNRGGA
jgi:hypothetical protein